MKAPSREKIDTTKGIVEIRALSRKEANEIQKINREMRVVKTDEERFTLEDKQEAILNGCIVSGTEYMDDIESGEYMQILNAFRFCQGNTRKKTNVPS